MNQRLSEEKMLLLLDAHVHFYDCFDPGLFLDSAHANFARTARRLGNAENFLGVLLLSEGSRENWFSKLMESCGPDADASAASIGDWAIETTSESMSLVANHADAARLVIVAGRQVATADRLEVLALCTDRSFGDGQPTDETLRQVGDAGAVAVVPWGAGKWLGHRGTILRDLMERSDGGRFFLGDNSARPVFWRNPEHFEIARQLGIRILPGTDPLPFRSESRRPGSFGFAMRGELSNETPARDLKRLLVDPQANIEPYGKLEGPVRFFVNQLAMQVRKHLA